VSLRMHERTAITESIASGYRMGAGASLFSDPANLKG